LTLQRNTTRTREIASGNATKRDGLVCINPGCYQLLQTQRFKMHSMSQHKTGQPWDKAYCDDYERAARDPALLYDPEGHKAAIPRLLGDLTVPSSD
jgi:hypothetical protein